jgi:hypothetical protein
VERFPVRWIQSKTSNGKHEWDFCSSVGSLENSKWQKLRISGEWGKHLIEETQKDRASKLSNLRNNIENHIELEGHKLVENVLKKRT